MYFESLWKDLILVCALIVPAILLGASDVESSDNASYEGLKPDEFMTKWLILGPIPASDAEKPDEEAQKNAFNTDFLADQGGESGVEPAIGLAHSIKDQEYKWQMLNSDKDEVPLTGILGEKDYAIAYAYAEIEMPEEENAILGLGSDDGVKVWLNGELIHEKWIGRPVNKDDDLIPVTFRKGKNHFLLKVQNMQGDWGFVCRKLSSSSMAEKFIFAAGKGNLDDLKMMLGHGVDVNVTIEPDLTALHNAKIRGRKDTVEFLLEKGADPNIPMPSKEKLADALFKRVIKGDSPGAAVLVAQNGEIIYQKGFGFADIGNHVPFTVETKSRIGSVTKQFTASAILKLQEEGKLNVDDKLSKFIPDYLRGDEVTIHHLLTHTSGIHSYTGKHDFMKTVTIEMKPEELINSFKNDEFDFNPGEKFLYNNSGYFLLGYIVGKVSGESYGDYLKNNFFDPLGMKDTGVHRSELILQNEAYGYSYINGKFERAANWDMSQAGGAGALYSTVGDLYRWNEAIFNGKILSKESLDAAFTPVKLNDGNTPKDLGSGGYGYGWVISEMRGLKEIQHGGGLNGFNSALIRYPDLNSTVVVLQNCIPSPPGMSASELAYEVSEIYFGEKMSAQESFAVDASFDPAAYDDYVGRYDYGGAILTVTKEGDKLLAQLTGQPKFEIFPNSKDKFFWKVTDAQIDFIRNEKGEVTHGIHHQGGRDITVQKLKEEQIATVDTDIYDDYAGEYKFSIGVLTVTHEGDGIFAQLTGQPKFEIFPRSETEFFLKIVNARIKFSRDESGKVIKAILSQAGMELEGTKIK